MNSFFPETKTNLVGFTLTIFWVVCGMFQEKQHGEKDSFELVISCKATRGGDFIFLDAFVDP